MFDGAARVVAFDHQQWWAWVGRADGTPNWASGWHAWISERYGYAAAYTTEKQP